MTHPDSQAKAVGASPYGRSGFSKPGWLRSVFALLLLGHLPVVGDAKVLVEAHRGDSINAPENTIAAFLSAAGSADLVEFDVRPTSDGHLVVMHDSTVNRTTNGVGAVTTLSLATIQSLDAGSWFSPRFVGEKVPTLSEAITAALSVGLIPLMERKDGSAATYHSELATLGVAPSSLRIISFDWNFLGDLNALDPAYNLGALGSGPLVQSVINSLLTRGIDFADWSHANINQASVDLVHSNGMELHAWTVDSPSRMQELIDLGVDGITTNAPAALRSLIDEAALTADLNGDGIVNGTDWQVYNAGRGANLTGLSREQSYAFGDLDGDRDNDVADFVTFKQLFERANGPGSLTFIEVPELSAITAVFVGLLFLPIQPRTA